MGHLAAAPFSQRLSAPRTVRTLDRRPVVLLGYVTDQHGRRLWPEIVSHTQFVRPETLDLEDNADGVQHPHRNTSEAAASARHYWHNA